MFAVQGPLAVRSLQSLAPLHSKEGTQEYMDMRFIRSVARIDVGLNVQVEDPITFDEEGS